MFFPVNGDPYRDNVVLHLPMTGANNSTTFTDVSPTPKTITRYGDTKILTAQSKWGQGGSYFDGTGDYLELPSSSDVNFGTGDFTIEAWVYFTSVSVWQAVFANLWTNSYDNNYQFGIRSNAKLVFLYRAAPSTDLYTETSSLVSVNTWTHVAVSRQGANLRLFINGVNGGTSTSYGTASVGITGTSSVGRGSSTISDYLSAYVQDSRITKGIARYTSDFAVPSGPLAYRKPELPVRSIIQPSFHQIARLGL